MKYFDTHVHFFPDALAKKALTRLHDICHTPYHSTGTPAGTLEKFREWGCAGGMALHIATNEKQQDSVNRFAKESQKDSIYCFGSVYPYAKNALEKMEEIKTMGLYGIKFHPDYQEFPVDDPDVMPLYEKAEALGLPVAFHTGRDPYSPDLVHCPPKALAAIADTFPHLTIIAAHMGGMDMPEDAAKYLAGKKNVYFDTAYASYFLTPAQLEELIRLHGVDRVLFATDCPWSTMPKEKDLLSATGLTQVEREKIAWGNAAALFDINI